MTTSMTPTRVAACDQERDARSAAQEIARETGRLAARTAQERFARALANQPGWFSAPTLRSWVPRGTRLAAMLAKAEREGVIRRVPGCLCWQHEQLYERAV